MTGIKGLLLAVLMIFCCLAAAAQTADSDSARVVIDVTADELARETVRADTTPLFSQRVEAPKTTKRRGFVGKVVMPVVDFFMGVDTRYIKESEYNFQALEQAKYNYETYRISSPEGSSIGFSPRKSLKLGPYIGWSIIFVGVTVDLFHMGDESNRREWDLSLYTLPFVLDIYYRSGGSVCTIDHFKLPGIDSSPVHGMKFDEFDSDIYGFDLTYVFNHKKFSYPAAYNQGSPQVKSSGSFLAGIGFTLHSLTVDWEELISNIGGRLGPDFKGSMMDSLRFDKITYSDLSLSGGYAYNFVFAKNWLVGLSAEVGISFKYASSDSKGYLNDLGETIRGFRDFRFRDLSLDFVGRCGLVYNNGRWFAGASAVFNSFNYSTSRFTTSSNFGTVSLYAGINFGKKAAYRKDKKERKKGCET